MDPETKRAWRRLYREITEDTPIVLRGLARSAKRMPRKILSAAIRGFRSTTNRAKAWEWSFGDRKTLVSQLPRVRLRSPIYKA